MTDAIAVGIDVGGTKLLAAAVDGDGRILERRRVTSPIGDVVGLTSAIADLARDVGPGLPVGIGIAGIVGRDGELVYAPNLRLRQVPLATIVSDDLGVTVAVGNDANVALFGELRAGAARGARNAVMLTLGTGVGGGIAVEGELVLGRAGFAGEVGHLVVEDGGRRCPCGNDGCIEAYGSGTAIAAAARARIAAGETSTMVSVDAAAITGKVVSVAARAGDPLAMDVLRDAGHWLGVAIASLVNLLDPDTVVIGGGAADDNADLILPAIRAAASARVLGSPARELPPLVLAELGDDAGVVGAALLAHERDR